MSQCESLPGSIAVWIGLAVFLLAMVGMLALLGLCIWAAFWEDR